MPCPDRITVKSYLTPEEYEKIKTAANQTKLSISKYMAHVCLGYEVKSRVEYEAVLAMIRVNHDLSRLGNLLKLAIDQDAVNGNDISSLIDSIKQSKELLNEKINSICYQNI